ncbi:MAG: hypothetical protein DI592_14315, partial [Stenotrophomonas maltophilia]
TTRARLAQATELLELVRNQTRTVVDPADPWRGLGLGERDRLRLVRQPHGLDRDRTDRFECVAQDGAVRGESGEFLGHRRA